MLGRGPWLLVVLSLLVRVLRWVWLGVLCKDERFKLWEARCRVGWILAWALCSDNWDMFRVWVLCREFGFSFWVSDWVGVWVRDCVRMWFWLNRLARGYLFACSSLRLCSSASRCSTASRCSSAARCSFSLRFFFTSSSINTRCSRTRGTQFSGIFIPGGRYNVTCHCRKWSLDNSLFMVTPMMLCKS